MQEQKRVLMVEDEANWQDTLQDILAGEGHSVITATSYGEALGELLRKPIDLAIVDLRLSPGDEENREGMNLLFDLAGQGTPAIIVTGYGEPKLVKEAYYEYGVFSFLDKASFDSEKFRELVQEALAMEKLEARRELTLEEKEKIRRMTRDFYQGKVVTFD